ncbi:dipeptidase 1 (renal) [Gaertneriomyces sp. JEL0708]|nr:dipeptidase 1 (renal) [Gaertneriomyces sp. JEL0708]
MKRSVELLSGRAARDVAPHRVMILLTALLLAIIFVHSCSDSSKTVGFHLGGQSTEALPEDDYLGRAHQLLKRVPLIDGHNDLPIALQAFRNGQINDVNLTTLPDPFKTDMNRLKQGRVGAQFWSGFIPCGSERPVQFTMEQIDLISRIIESYPDTLVAARTTSDIRRIHKAGRVASLIGLEGGHQMNNSLATLRKYYDLGVRYMTLTHTCHTDWADSCSPEPVHNGLTNFGEDVILEMNRLGMMVDISHVSHKTMSDAIRVSRAPVIFSHSSVYELCKIQRNVPDHVLRMLPEKDGVVMINFYPRFVSCSGNSTLEAVADHIFHVVKVAGPAHVGIGSDFDGIDSVPDGLEDVSKYPSLVAELLERGLSEKDVEGIVGGNLLRVMEKVEYTSATLRQEMKPIERRIGDTTAPATEATDTQSSLPSIG